MNGMMILDRNQYNTDTRMDVVPVSDISTDQRIIDSQQTNVCGQCAVRHDGNQTGVEHHVEHETVASHDTIEPFLDDPILGMFAAQLDDYEDRRKATANRLRILTTTKPDSDGVMRGFGFDKTHPQVAMWENLYEVDKQAEDMCVKMLEKTMKQHPLYPWSKIVKGLGAKTFARLLSCIGDPYVTRFGMVRTVSQLWAYMGLHTMLMSDGTVVAARNMRGLQSNWKTIAKTRLYIVETGMLKAGIRRTDDGERVAVSDYGQVYIDRREHTQLTHPEWTNAHRHNDAMRIMGKRFVKELWREAKRLHTEREETYER